MDFVCIAVGDSQKIIGSSSKMKPKERILGRWQGRKDQEFVSSGRQQFYWQNLCDTTIFGNSGVH